jgi:hypothetical protein
MRNRTLRITRLIALGLIVFPEPITTVIGMSMLVMQMERSRDKRSRGMSRPYTYIARNTSKYKCIEFHGISEREKVAL